MSKAMILIDVPDHLDITQFKVDCKLVNKVYINYPSRDNKLLDLKPIPQKLPIKSDSIMNTFKESTKYRHIGFNECIDKILGG